MRKSELRSFMFQIPLRDLDALSDSYSRDFYNTGDIICMLKSF